jgi:hypothetical protein
MKTSDELKAEIAKLSRELAERQLKDIASDEQYGSRFEAAEVLSAEIGDTVSRELLEHQARLVNDQRPPDVDCKCPQCQQPAGLKRIRKRQLQTIRGQIEIPEPEHYCKKCRRSFFPSDATARS